MQYYVVCQCLILLLVEFKLLAETVTVVLHTKKRYNGIKSYQYGKTVMKKVALITGSSRGIGRATAEIFAENGYAIAINCIQNTDAAESIVADLRSLGKDAIFVQADVSSAEQVDRMVHSVRKTFGQIDVLVNNAGISQQKLFTEIDTDEWQKMFGVHVDGTFYCCKAVLPDMICRKSGTIINVSSIWGMVGASCEVHYSAAKAAVIGLTKALAKEVGPSGINVNCVAPGVIATEMNDAFDDDVLNQLKEDTPLCRNGTAREIAELIYFLASDKASFVTGQIISPNGGFVI